MVMIIGTLMNIFVYLFDYIDQYIKSFGILKDLSYLFLSPREIFSILKMKSDGKMKKYEKIGLDELGVQLNDLDFCYATLNKVSRSFSFVIEELPEELKDVVCIFYLILRGLDSVEDDINYPNKDKILLLRHFHQNLLIDQWSIENIGDKQDYRILLKHFGKVINVFKSLDLKYQRIIVNITQRMGNGMSEFVGRSDSIETIEDYNLYCHYVAGLVGYGLSSIFYSSGLELNIDQDLSNHMGLFLQKTNLIRDYLEDIQSGRSWWPKQIWINYSNEIKHFRDYPFNKESIECLNQMIIDALEHVPHVLNYLNQIKNNKIFQFCSIPQLMSIATLCELCNNPRVFTSIVKISKRLSIKLMINCSNMKQIHQWFDFFIQQISKKINSSNEQIYPIIEQIKSLCDDQS